MTVSSTHRVYELFDGSNIVGRGSNAGVNLDELVAYSSIILIIMRDDYSISMSPPDML